MPKLPRWTASQAEAELLRQGFVLLRTKGSHRIYGMSSVRIVVPFHTQRTLHPKIVKQVLQAIADAGGET